jgi:photosystem II stability/assembly factor-like uncharacterized protein
MKRISPAILILAVVLVACSSQSGQATPAGPTATGTFLGVTPATITTPFNESPVPVSTDTAPPPPLPVLASPALTRIDFKDSQNGWGIAVNDNGYVLRTVNGGSTWLNATPKGSDQFGGSTSLIVLDLNTVWVLVPGTDFFSGTLYRTNDGGLSWDSNPVPFGGGFLKFLDANTGRMLADRGARDGLDAVELFQTSDGGASWVSVINNDPTRPDASNSLPLIGIKNGMTFLDAQAGWITAASSEEGQVPLYVTHDGGVSWSLQSLALLQGYDAYQYLPQAPVFFGKDGFLPLMIKKPGMAEFTFYTTHDGGLSWSGDPANPGKVIQSGLPAFADALHIWSWDGGKSLYMSSDGAQTWQTLIPSLDLSGRLSQVAFLPSDSGSFTGWALSQLDGSGHSQLYQTSDGSTWKLLIP